jgi:hypothetical protein
MALFISFVTAIVTVIVLGIWLVVGFLLWIPLLTRMMLIFIAAIIASLYSNKDPTNAQLGLEKAIRFYAEGVETILSTMRGGARGKPFVQDNVNIGRALKELVIAAGFWIFLILGWSVFLNSELVNWGFSLPRGGASAFTELTMSMEARVSGCRQATAICRQKSPEVFAELCRKVGPTEWINLRCAAQ